MLWSCLAAGRAKLHPALRICDGLEPQGGVDSVRVGGCEQELAESLMLRMLQGESDHCPSESAAPVFRVDVDVAQPGERRPIRDDAHVSYLAGFRVCAHHR